MPSMVGVIDGSHVKILAPKEQEWTYINWKQEHSINVQVGEAFGNMKLAAFYWS